MSKVINDKNDSIRNKIAKLLEMADPTKNPEAGEAQAALLKARELMAKHKLRPEECKADKDAKVLRVNTRVTCTAMTNPWAVALSAVISEHYCCRSFRNHMTGRKVQTIGMVGLEGDIEIAQRIFEYAYDCVISEQKHTIKRDPYDAPGTYRERCNALGWGFVKGVSDAFRAQEEEHQEWGLVMVVPQQVDDSMKDMGKPKSFGRDRMGFLGDRQTGYEAGRDFNPSERLNTAPARAALEV
jgi:hypothetical protein